MAYLGLVPSEHSSGQTERRGAIAKAGNTHAAGCSSRPLGTTAIPWSESCPDPAE
jgi:Transposase IS116/IS110/IS902 family